tara:strand:- start:1682 stop:3061 length:1380 start_codon:yes stop_codon:yes gene_type:complete
MVKFMNENIFREYDIRGIASTDLTDDVVLLIGKAFGYYLSQNNQKIMSISGDIRYTTNRIKKAFINGVISQGIDVCDLGVLPTPVNYFSLYNTEISNSVQITGSHNPSEYNGLKISFNKKPFYGKDIKALKKLIKKHNFKSCYKLGEISNYNILDDYYNYIMNHFKINKKIKVVMDCGNAAGCIIAPKIYKDIGVDLYELYCDTNPDFPNHHPDPTVDDNLQSMIDVVRKNKYDLGIAFDGDADRIVAVDHKGNIIRADILLSVLLTNIIKPNDTVIYDVKCSKSLEDTIKTLKAKPIMWKTGHSLIKNKMIETNSKIGGEMSGHIFFADNYFGYDDGIYVGLRLIELLITLNKSLHDCVESIPKYISTPEIRIDCNSDEEKIFVTKKLIKYFTNKYECITIDGVRISYNHGWALIRSSNTQPVIVCRFESNSIANLKNIKNEIFNKIKEFGEFDINEL